MRELAPQPVEHRRLGQLDGVARPGRRAAPAVEDDERYERDAVRHMAANESTSSEAPPTSAPSTAALREQLRGVLRLDRAAVEHRQVEQGLDRLVRLLRHLGRGGLPGADRPDRLVGDHEVVVGLEHADLAAEDVVGLARLALGQGLADAGDHVQPALQRGAAAPRDGLVGLAEVLAAFRVADERAVDAELAEHRRGDLAGERAFALPVAVLGEDTDLRAGECLHGCGERDVRRSDDDVDVVWQRRVAQRAAELARLAPAP